MTTAEKTLRIRVTTEHEDEIDRRAAMHGLKRSAYVRMAALNYPTPTNAAALAQRGQVKSTVPATTGVQESSNGAPQPLSRADRVERRTRELRNQGVSTYAAMDQARDEIAAEDRHE